MTNRLRLNIVLDQVSPDRQPTSTNAIAKMPIATPLAQHNRPTLHWHRDGSNRTIAPLHLAALTAVERCYSLSPTSAMPQNSGLSSAPPS